MVYATNMADQINALIKANNKYVSEAMDIDRAALDKEITETRPAERRTPRRRATLDTMSTDDETPDGARRTLSTTRMEAFSDGVIAIAATLLVLELALRPPGSALEQFLRGWPSYLAYVVSFLTIGAAWIVHNALTDRIDRADSILLRLNLLYLMLVAFLPYPTRLVADSLSHDVAAERVAVSRLRHHPPRDPSHVRRHGPLQPARTPPRRRRDRHRPPETNARNCASSIAAYLVTIAIAIALPAVAIRSTSAWPSTSSPLSPKSPAPCAAAAPD